MEVLARYGPCPYGPCFLTHLISPLFFGVVFGPMKKKKLSGKGCRQKGHAFERWTANEFKKIYPEAKRHLEYQVSEAKGIDVSGTGIYRVQCKRGKKYSSLKAIEEIQVCPIEGGVPILITKGDGKEPLACLPFSHLLRLISFFEKKGLVSKN